jgi:hypothetical protein
VRDGKLRYAFAGEADCYLNMLFRDFAENKLYRNSNENKISYYSFADGEISKRLALSCGFLPCALRCEQNI